MDWADQRWQLDSWSGSYILVGIGSWRLAVGMLKLMLHTTTSRYIAVIWSMGVDSDGLGGSKQKGGSWAVGVAVTG